MDLYQVLVFFHILLFAYWLGSDLGVHLMARAYAKPGTPLEYRLWMRQTLMKVDMAPRCALILILPLGWTMALNWGFDMAAWALAVMWVAAIAWFLIMWTVFLKSGTPVGEGFRKVDMMIRYAVMVSMFALGASSLAIGWPVEEKWLGAKIFLFGVVVALGVALRLSSKPAPAGYAKLRAGDMAGGDAILKPMHDKAAKVAITLWLVIILMAFLGAVKPF